MLVVAMVAFATASAVLLKRARAVSYRRRSLSSGSATVLPESQLERAGRELRQGRLVAFPTETVYGLGASALNPQACLEVFRTKGRPLTDPLIVHVTTREWARRLLDLTPHQEQVFEALASKFWPGPLTLVSNASVAYFGNQSTVNVLSASTGQIGVRIPSHAVARRLIDFAQVPVAAPSANRFGHVSPTCAQHVVDDLGQFPIFVIDSAQQSNCCAVGIESTVVGLTRDGQEEQQLSITLFRRGGISEAELQRVLDAELGQGKVSIRLSPALAAREAPLTKQEEEKEDAAAEAQVAPGQLLTHYSPDNVECFLWQMASGSGGDLPLPFPLEETVVVDFNGALQQHAAKALAYRDLSPSGNLTEACHDVFSVLRWTETVQGARAVILPDVSSGTSTAENGSAALDDRLYRAASGKRVNRI